MPFVCPSCGLRRNVERVIRLELCPRCQAEGKDVYLIDDAGPVAGRRRHDLIGLLATARGELSDSKSDARRERP